MNFRIFVWAFLALSAAGDAAVCAAPADTLHPPAASYDVDNHNPQVTVRTASGKVLLTQHIATPQMSFFIDFPTLPAK